MAFAWMDADYAAYPLGGSLPVRPGLEQKAVSLGADIVYRAAVKRVIVESGLAVGVELEDGRVQKARRVVAACDAHAVFERLLEGRVKDPMYEALFKSRETSISLIQVSLGVRPDQAWDSRDCPTSCCCPSCGRWWWTISSGRACECGITRVILTWRLLATPSSSSRWPVTTIAGKRPGQTRTRTGPKKPGYSRKLCAPSRNIFPHHGAH